ncbi:hypothetical protein ABT324_30415 [Saccharopolyspora sp. NPDC000359]|uniref:hypothetical protein n=1 Tax=Saccharopolyspora sp. NPDC000359 TaxID=3154251 RepID=UPI00331EE0B7
MAVKIVHTTRAQELRFGSRAAAERYAAQHGGSKAWWITTVPRAVVARDARADSRA